MAEKHCLATIEFGDDYGDNPVTFHCQLQPRHKGPHQEKGDVGHHIIPMPYTLTWEGSTAELVGAMRRRYDAAILPGGDVEAAPL